MVLASCTQFLDVDASVKPITSKMVIIACSLKLILLYSAEIPSGLLVTMQSYFRGVIDDMAAKSLRCVAFAYRPYDRNSVPTTNEEVLAEWNLPEEDLILLAIVGIKVLNLILNLFLQISFMYFS